MDHVEHEENVIEEEGSANEFTEDNDIAVGNELHNDKASCDENGKEKEQFAVSDARDKLEPRVGMEFDDDEQAYQFYNEYARRVGFSIRKQHLTKNKSGQVTFRRFVCYREGYYRNRPFDKDAKILRTDGRTGCNAHIGIKRLKSGKFCVHRFEPEHNHKLASSKKVHLLRSQRQADETQMNNNKQRRQRRVLSAEERTIKKRVEPSDRHMRSTLSPVLLLELEWLSAFVESLEGDGFSDKPNQKKMFVRMKDTEIDK
ncbi:hypothetical protein B296_00047915 [Ensete ventricosum]|uniref:FAR1 domain-containing protein n=1 Tax=Ensete ventricosum TaxID=4639 RepID=A0A426YPR9_ENSVE|nr:hypothetical protein B296_00047915 [Ensete ventricosum]